MRRTQSALLLAAAALALVVWAGCGEYEPAKRRGRSAAPEAVGVVVDPTSLAAPVGARAPRTPTSGETTPPGPGPAAPASQAPAAESAPQAERYHPQMVPQSEVSQGTMIREKADVGMGKKGHYNPGIITTPLATFWRSQEAAAYRIQVPHALNLYKGMYGHFPKTLEEFENEILKPNNIKLPELPAGHFYVYDPEEGELQVARPK